ncbi:MAG: prohibitin family protein, partial [Zoogloeaceae bacterium]|nr:prohibitin family protein [Zoogloeaceae bacterium]
MEIDNLPDGETPDILPGRDARSQRAQEILASLRRFGAAHFRGILACGILGIAAYTIATHLPFQTIERGDAGLRVNQWTGDNRYFQAGSVLVIPGIHELHTLPLRDRVYQPKREGTEGFSFQSIEGLTVAVDFSVRYALDPGKMATTLRTLPDDIDGEIVLPAIQGALHKTFPRYTVREIFSERRQEIEEKITKELETRLAKDGIKLKSLAIGKIDLPPDYLAGMEKMLEAELQTERMRFTLELKEKQVKESELTAEADKVRREKAAEAAAQEQVIAAQAQSEAMKHILPFKEKQIKQRELEAEAAKVARLMDAQAQAEARL